MSYTYDKNNKIKQNTLSWASMMMTIDEWTIVSGISNWCVCIHWNQIKLLDEYKIIDVFTCDRDKSSNDAVVAAANARSRLSYNSQTSFWLGRSACIEKRLFSSPKPISINSKRLLHAIHTRIYLGVALQTVINAIC